jgi:hypothetical protein
MIIYGGRDKLQNVLSDLVCLDLAQARWFYPRVIGPSANAPGPLQLFTMNAIFHPKSMQSSTKNFFDMKFYYDINFTKQNSGIYLFGGQDGNGLATNGLYILKPSEDRNEFVVSWT